MQSLKDKFDEVCLRARAGRRLESTGSTPIYYLVFSTKQILEVKQQTTAWIAKLENNDWDVVTLSFSEAVNSILRRHKFRDTWLRAEKPLLEKARPHLPLAVVSEITTTLRKALTEGPELLTMVRAKLDEAANKPNGLLLLTDLEALHPFLRINTIEAQIMDQIRCPVVVLYPGKREGKTSLRFLEFYPADPSYRSEHID
jgi:hypothetical protein